MNIYYKKIRKLQSLLDIIDDKESTITITTIKYFRRSGGGKTDLQIVYKTRKSFSFIKDEKKTKNKRTRSDTINKR